MNDSQRQAEEHFSRGNQFDENGQREPAIREWLQAIDLDPNHTGAHFNLGIASMEDSDNARAIEHLREVMRLDPLDTEARQLLAEIYLDEDEPGESINQLRQLLNIDPNDTEAAGLLAQIYFDLERWDEAAGALESSGMSEEDANLWFELGMVYEMQQHRIDDAILAYRRALLAQPEHAGAERALRRLNVPVEDATDGK